MKKIMAVRGGSARGKTKRFSLVLYGSLSLSPFQQEAQAIMEPSQSLKPIVEAPVAIQLFEVVGNDALCNPTKLSFQESTKEIIYHPPTHPPSDKIINKKGRGMKSRARRPNSISTTDVRTP